MMLMETLFGADGLSQLKENVVVCVGLFQLNLTRFANITTIIILGEAECYIVNTSKCAVSFCLPKFSMHFRYSTNF